MSLSIYLFFPGNCAEAFDFYKSVFGGDFMTYSTFAEGPPDMGIAEEDKDKIMHVCYPLGDNVLMGSDSVDGCGEVGPAGGNFAISYSPATKAQADEVFARLMEGGKIQMELAETFWDSYFGQGKDKFGINWMINVDLQQS